MLTKLTDFIIDEINQIDLEDKTIFAFVATVCAWVCLYFLVLN
jgi:hypothetical protein